MAHALSCPCVCESRSPRRRRITAPLLALLLTGCTTFGLPGAPPDPGPWATVPVCTNAPTRVVEAWAPEAARYRLRVEPVPVMLERRGASLTELLDAVEAQTQARCPRTLAVFPLRADDVFLAGVLGVYGLTRYDTERGYGIALPFYHAIRHELLHVLGCDHGFTMTRCYERLMALKGNHAAHVR